MSRSSDHHDHPTHAGHHDHLWHLPDGTGLHAPIGSLTRDPDTGTACCHLCGQWYRALGSHIRVHGYSGVRYREVMQLTRTTPLAAPEVSAAIAVRQRSAYATSAEHRQRLEAGHQLARTTRAASPSNDDLSIETITRRAAALAVGRATQVAARETARTARLALTSHDDLGTYLRDAYRSGRSIEDLRQATGLGRSQLQTALRDAGVEIRRAGLNSRNGKRSRAASADARAAERVGTSDIDAWLAHRHRDGVSFSELARLVGHSNHWVRWRIQRSLGQSA